MSSMPKKPPLKERGPSAMSRAIASIYLGGAVFSAIVTVVYYSVDHGLRDVHMTLLFIPNLLAALIWYIMALCKYHPCDLAKYLFYMASPFHWVYLFMKGAYDMAKVTSNWLFTFLLVAALLYVASFVVEIIHRANEKKQGVH